MKKKLFIIVISLSALAQSSCKKNDPSNEKARNLSKMIEESSSSRSADFCSITSIEPDLHFGLDRDTSLNNYVFTQSQLSAGLFNFHTNFKYDNSGTIVELDSSKQTLSIDELLQLFSELESDSSVHYVPDSNYSALRLFFGMEAKKIILIYEPIVLKPTGVPKECSIASTNKYFRVDSNGYFIPITASSQIMLMNNLQSSSSKIRITHPINPSTYNFIDNLDSTGDIRSNIISFQQISKMYCDNTQGVSLTDRINFTIVANRNASLTSNYRMHVVPNFRLGLSTAVSGTYKNYAADYAQMCPVKCNIVSINYYY